MIKLTYYTIHKQRNSIYAIINILSMNTESNKFVLPIGPFSSTTTKSVLETFVNARHVSI